MSDTDPAAKRQLTRKWTYGRRESDADPTAAKSSRPKKWTYGRPVIYRPPWREVLRPVVFAAMVVFVYTGLFRLTTVGNPEKFRARNHAIEIVDMWYAARMSGSPEAEMIHDERQAVAVLLTGIEMSARDANNRVQLKLSSEDCEAALSFLKWNRAEGSNHHVLSFKLDDRE